MMYMCNSRDTAYYGDIVSLQRLENLMLISLASILVKSKVQ